jgi:hypothetical protein
MIAADWTSSREQLGYSLADAGDDDCRLSPRWERRLDGSDRDVTFRQSAGPSPDVTDAGIDSAASLLEPRNVGRPLAGPDFPNVAPRRQPTACLGCRLC